jgi:ERCC4-type nuclease
MRIIIDKREKSLYENLTILISKLEQSTPNHGITIIQQQLDIGDILIQTNDEKDIALVERKSFTDLLASIKDGRYEEQSHRLINTSGLPPHSILYLLEGMFSQIHNPKDKQIIYSSMTTLQFFKGFSVYRVSTTQEAAEWLLFTGVKLKREIEKGKSLFYSISQSPTLDSTTNIISTDLQQNEQEEPKNYCNFVKKVKKENITPENIGEIILCQIPGISSVTAITIMKQYGTFPKLILALQENPQCLTGIVCETANGKTRKISKSSIENIRRFLL